MINLLDTATKAKPRHPEKAHRPDNEVMRKPDWIRVKAPVSPIYKETHKIVKENGLVTVCEPSAPVDPLASGRGRVA